MLFPKALTKFFVMSMCMLNENLTTPATLGTDGADPTSTSANSVTASSTHSSQVALLLEQVEDPEMQALAGKNLSGNNITTIPIAGRPRLFEHETDRPLPVGQSKQAVGKSLLDHNTSVIPIAMRPRLFEQKKDQPLSLGQGKKENAAQCSNDGLVPPTGKIEVGEHFKFPSSELNQVMIAKFVEVLITLRSSVTSTSDVITVTLITLFTLLVCGCLGVALCMFLGMGPAVPFTQGSPRLERKLASRENVIKTTREKLMGSTERRDTFPRRPTIIDTPPQKKNTYNYGYRRNESFTQHEQCREGY